REVTLVDEPLAVEVLREDLRVLVDGPVLEGGAFAGLELTVQLELRGEEEELGAERPGLHVRVEILQVRVLLVRLEERLQAVLARQKRRELGLPGADVSCDGDEPASSPGAHRPPSNRRPRWCQPSIAPR